jgi:trehalose 6-phosphate phosphatase
MAETAPGSRLRSRVQAFLSEARGDPSHTLIALDIDGTVSEIAPTPEEAVVAPRMRSLLARLGDVYLLAFISGRDAEVALRMVDVPGATYVGAHGLETLDEAGVHSTLDREAFVRETQALAEEVRSDVPEVGPHIETKRWGVAFHYRLLDEPALVRRLLRRVQGGLQRRVQRRLRRVQRRLPFGLKVRHGKKVVEVVPDVPADKGSALLGLLERLAPRRVLFMGDDRTDVAAFCALGEQAERGVAFLRVAVLGIDEPPADLLANADHQVRGVDGTYRLLAQLLPD